MLSGQKCLRKRIKTSNVLQGPNPGQQKLHAPATKARSSVLYFEGVSNKSVNLAIWFPGPSLPDFGKVGLDSKT